MNQYWQTNEKKLLCWNSSIDFNVHEHSDINKWTKKMKGEEENSNSRRFACMFAFVWVCASSKQSFFSFFLKQTNERTWSNQRPLAQFVKNKWNWIACSPWSPNVCVYARGPFSSTPGRKIKKKTTHTQHELRLNKLLLLLLTRFCWHFSYSAYTERAHIAVYA